MSRIYKFINGEYKLIHFEESWHEYFKQKGHVKIIAFKDKNDSSFKIYPFLELDTVWYNTDGSVVIFELKDGTLSDEIPLERLIGIEKW